MTDVSQTQLLGLMTDTSVAFKPRWGDSLSKHQHNNCGFLPCLLRLSWKCSVTRN